MDNPKRLYIDIPDWDEPAKVDDFLVAISKKQSNSVYHIAEVRSVVPRKKQPGISRYYLNVYKTDLITAIKRDEDQKVIPVYWYSRGKKK